MDYDIYSTSSKFNSRITLEAKGSGVLTIIVLFGVNSCPGNIPTMVNYRGRFGIVAVWQVNLSGDYQRFSFVYTHQAYGCDVKDMRQKMLGFNGGDYTIRNLVVANADVNQDSLGFKNNVPYTRLYNNQTSLSTVTFENSNETLDLGPLQGQFDYSIDTVIGPPVMSTLSTFKNVQNIHANGAKNFLTCSRTDSHLWGGSSQSTFIVGNIPGTCYLENFSILNGDILNLQGFDGVHNYTQLLTHIDNLCGSSTSPCVRITLGQVQIILRNITKQQIQIMTIIYSAYPCVSLCPDCRTKLDCDRCSGCVEGLCDLSGCYNCTAPLFMSLKSLGFCQTQCPINSYTDSVLRNCTPCLIDYCGWCDQNIMCQQCLNATLLYDGKCYVQCPNRTYSSVDSLGRAICVDCGANCDVCDSNGCLECQTDYKRFFGKESDLLYRCIPKCDFYDASYQCVCLPYIQNEVPIPFLGVMIHDYDPNNDFVCQSNLPFIPNCPCFPRLKPSNLGILAQCATMRKILGFPDSELDVLCNKQSSIFSDNCHLSIDKFNNLFSPKLKHYKTIPLYDISKRSYDPQKFKDLFIELAGSSKFLVLLNIINKNSFSTYLLIGWHILYEEAELSLRNFGLAEKFLVAAPDLGCGNDGAAFREFSIDFGYGNNDSYWIQSAEVFKIMDYVEPYKEMLNYTDCKNYIKNYEYCKNSAGPFDDFFELQARRVVFLTRNWKALTNVQKCAVIDQVFEKGDVNLLRSQYFLQYINGQEFSQIPNISNMTNRTQMTLQMLQTNKIPNITQRACVERVMDIEIQRNCSLEPVKEFRNSLFGCFQNHSVYVNAINFSTFENLGALTVDGQHFLEITTLNAFLQAVNNTPNSSFIVKTTMISLPEQYLIDQWQGLCGSLTVYAENSKQTVNFMSGQTLHLVNPTLEIDSAMINSGFIKNYEGIYSYKSSESLDLSKDSVMMFQRMWNSRNPDPINKIIEDGVFSWQVRQKLMEIDRKGFIGACS